MANRDELITRVCDGFRSLAAALKVPEDQFDECRSGVHIMETTGLAHYAEHEPDICVRHEWEGI